MKEQDFEDFENDFQIRPMLKEKKLIVLKNAFTKQNFKEKFSKNIKKIKELKDIILFYEEKEIHKNNSLFNLLKKEARFQEFKLLDGLELKDWAKKEFNSVKIESKALELLVDYVGQDLWRMSNEINKLINYKNKEAVVIEDINLLVKPKIQTDIFKTIDAIASKDKKTALFLLHKHLDKGDSPLYLFSMIVFQFRNILAVKSFIPEKQSFYGLPKIPGIHPYVARKSFFQAKKFKLEELKKIYRKLFKADFDIKTGKIEPITAIDLLIAGI